MPGGRPCLPPPTPAPPHATPSPTASGTCTEFFPRATISKRVTSVVMATFLLRCFRGGRPRRRVPGPLASWPPEGAPCA